MKVGQTRKSSKVSTEELLEQATRVNDLQRSYRVVTENLVAAEDKLKVLVKRASAITVKKYILERGN